MKLFGRKREQPTQFHVPDNPFSSLAEPGRKTIEFDLGAEPDALIDPDSYFRAVSMGVQRFPWFGEFHIAPARGIEYELRRRTLPGIRRVLVSFLAGRPMSSVARRVRTSRRTVYSIIRLEIYDGYNDIDRWADLGLIKMWDVPEILFDTTRLPNGIWFVEGFAPVICLMCHRLIGHVPASDRRYDSSFIEGTENRLQTDSDQYERIRGHLIAHFDLYGRPTPNESFETPFGLLSRNPGKYVATRWLDRVDHVAIGAIWENVNSTLPMIGEASPTEDEVREYYRNLLES